MQVDFFDTSQRQKYNDLLGKNPQSLSDSERDFCFEMYHREECEAERMCGDEIRQFDEDYIISQAENADY